MEADYPEVEVLTHSQEIEENAILKLLYNEGYRYEYTVENAQQVGPGETSVKLLQFKLYNQENRIVVNYNNYNHEANFEAYGYRFWSQTGQ